MIEFLIQCSALVRRCQADDPPVCFRPLPSDITAPDQFINDSSRVARRNFHFLCNIGSRLLTVFAKIEQKKEFMAAQCLALQIVNFFTRPAGNNDKFFFNFMYFRFSVRSESPAFISCRATIWLASVVLSVSFLPAWPAE